MGETGRPTVAESASVRCAVSALCDAFDWRVHYARPTSGDAHVMNTRIERPGCAVQVCSSGSRLHSSAAHPVRSPAAESRPCWGRFPHADSALAGWVASTGAGGICHFPNWGTHPRLASRKMWSGAGGVGGVDRSAGPCGAVLADEPDASHPGLVSSAGRLGTASERPSTRSS